MMMKLPEKIPAEPTPEIARPTIRAAELDEVAQMREPTSNIRMEHR